MIEIEDDFIVLRHTEHPNLCYDIPLRFLKVYEDVDFWCNHLEEKEWVDAELISLFYTLANSWVSKNT